MRVGENTGSHIAYLLFVLLYFVQKLVAKVFENSTKLPAPHVALSQFAACVSIDILLYLAEMGLLRTAISGVNYGADNISA